MVLFLPTRDLDFFAGEGDVDGESDSLNTNGSANLRIPGDLNGPLVPFRCLSHRPHCPAADKLVLLPS